MLKALERGGLVEQNPDSKAYRLGWPLLVLAAGAGNTPLLRSARPVLQTLVARTSEVALLSVQQGNRSLYWCCGNMAPVAASGRVSRHAALRCTALPPDGRCCSTATTPS